MTSIAKVLENEMISGGEFTTERIQREELKIRRILFGLEKRKINKKSKLYTETRASLVEIRTMMSKFKMPLLAPVKERLSDKECQFYRKKNDLYVRIDNEHDIKIFEYHGFKYIKKDKMWCVKDVF